MEEKPSKTKKTKKIVLGTLTIFVSSVVIMKGYKIVTFTNDFKKGIINTIDDVKEGIKDFFTPDPDRYKPEEPSATRIKTVENLGKEVDDILGNDTSWDDTSLPDTYGEALSGVVAAFLEGGNYEGQIPTNDEIKNLIDDDLVKVYELSKKDVNKKPETYGESLKKVFNMYVGIDYEEGNFIDMIRILEGCAEFVFEDKSYKKRNVKFDDLDQETRLYFIDNMVDMNNWIASRYPDYSEKLKNSSACKNIAKKLVYLGNFTAKYEYTDENYDQFKEKVNKLKK